MVAKATQKPETPAGLDAEAAAFADWATVPSVTRGVLFGAPLQLQLTSSQRDLEANKQRLFTSTFSVDAANLPAFGIEQRGVSHTLPSPSGRRLLVVRPVPEKEHSLLELWGGGRLLRELEVPFSVHGQVYGDGYYESLAWNADESRVAYVAEAVPTVRTPLWAGRHKAGGGEAGWRGVGEHVEDWGEQLTGKRVGALFVLDVLSGAVHAVRGLPPDSTCGQVVWSPGGTNLVFAAWPHATSSFPTRRRLGSVFCLNRHCQVWMVEAPSDNGGPAAAVCLTPGARSAFSPRFNPSGTLLAFLSHDAAVTSGAHNSAAAMHVLPWAGEAAAGAPRCLLPVVTAPMERGGWPGLYTASALTRNPWISNNELLVASTYGSADAILVVDTAGINAVHRITPPAAEHGHWQLLDVRGNTCAAVVSTPTSPPCLALASAPDWCWRKLLPVVPELFSPAVQAGLGSLTWQLLPSLVPGQVEGAPLLVESILMLPAPGSTPPPVILVPHGGPHTASVAGWSMPLAFLCAQGYAILAVNYRGSTGFGLDALESLLGRAGRQDIDDCLLALDSAAKLVDATRAAVVGGSHGGFIGAHLVAQTDRFKCACLRNPVTDVATMVGVTDIPEWTFVEAGLQNIYDDVPSIDALRSMRDMSPVAFIDNVKAPVLVLIGAKDRRVPPSNGISFAHALRQRGAAVKLIVFPEDEHGLTLPRTEMESYLNILAMLRDNLPVHVR